MKAFHVALVGIAAIAAWQPAAATSRTDRWVDSDSFDCVVTYGKGVVSAAVGKGVGRCVIAFDADVSRCVYNVTLGGPLQSRTVGVGGASRRAGDANSVNVFTFDGSGSPAGQPFSLFVGCK